MRMSTGWAAVAACAALSGSVLQAQDGTITACVGKQGTLRIVASGTPCMRGETPIQWNTGGPQGPAGPAGPAGPPGPQGEPGDPGAGLSSLEALAGLACQAGNGAGTVGVAMNPFSNAVELACTPVGQLQLSVAVRGSGSVSSSPPGIACGSGQGDCSQGFAAGGIVTLTQSPGVVGFAGWGGPCSGTAPTCQVTMDQAQQVTATFHPLLTVAITTYASERVGSCAFLTCVFADSFTESKARVTVVDDDTDQPLGVCNADTTVSFQVVQFSPVSVFMTTCKVPVPLGHRVRLHADDMAVLGGTQTFVQWGPEFCSETTSPDCGSGVGIEVNRSQSAFFGK